MKVRIVAFSVLGGLLLIGFLGACERLVSDSATRLAFQIRNESLKLRLSGKDKRTFEHYPATWPDGLTGDYRIEITDSKTSPAGKRSIGTAKSYDGPVRSHTSYHNNYVQVPKDLMAAHRKGEPTTITLEIRNGIVQLTELR